MSRLFFEVFPDLKLKSELLSLMGQVQVEKVTTTSKKDVLHIYIHSKYLIQKKDIYEVEKRIKEQLFARAPIRISIQEKYTLSEQYSAEDVYREYKDSILMELREMSVVALSMLQEGEIAFPDKNTMTLSLQDSIVAQGKEAELTDYLKMVWNERCQVPLTILVSYRETEKKFKKENEQKLKLELAEIEKENAKAMEYAKAVKDMEDGKQSGAESERGGQDGKKEQAGRTSQSEKSGNGKKPYGSFKLAPKLSDDPNLIYGRNFEGEPIRLEELVGEVGEVIIHGQIFTMEVREIRNEKSILMFAVTDFTDSIMVKMFTRNDQLHALLDQIKTGAFLTIKGVTTIDKFDRELTIGSVTGVKVSSDFRVKRKDTSIKKRVELHCHTKMSDMDGVSEASALVKQAHAWGHPAIAITDHGLVQAFPDANHVIEGLDKEDPFKVLYGVEGYLVDDLMDIAVGATDETLDDCYVVFDLETTGFSSISDKIIEIGAVKVENGNIVDHYSTFVNPGRPIPFRIEELTGINDEMVKDARTIEEVLPEFLEFVKGAVLVAHNASFDVGFIEQNCRYQDIQPDFISVDTVALSRILLPTISKYKLNNVAKALNISLENHHRAVDDAGCTAKIFIKLCEMLKERNITTLKGMNQFGNMNVNGIRKMPTYHVIILAQNEIGRVNLYKLISLSSLKYYARRPRIPKSELNKYREGLIVGSACEAGELFQAILNKKSPETIARIVDFYDYLEIQPLGNNQFMIASDKIPDVKNEEDLKELNRRIVKLGEEFNKPVVATCDVHFMNPEDEVYRRIIMAGKGFSDADDQAPLYLRTTEEMLQEFEYLGSEKAEEVVITNTNKIADMIEKISPIHPDKCPPVIEDSDQTLRKICYDRAHKMYGEDLPEVVTARLERELNSIISNGFAVMYIIAQKLVWKSNEDGYLVGSRGSVGSSFVATMAGITEVNPLSPHYYCSHCHYSDFDSEEVRAYAGGCGWDMPDKKCPVCGEQLIKDGFDIPFETFLGFKGNKEPDIDLNFSGDYQAKAHKYTEVIFGYGQTFKAGTIGTLAEKTAYGYVKGYYEERGMGKRRCEIERIADGCTGIHRTTGQHPGGIIVLPIGHDINSFTPVQHPANDMNTDIITTHFDYHSIDHNLLKLDILGHDDPTMIKMLEELVEQITGEKFDATKIPLDDPGVMSLFAGTKALGITPDDIHGIPVGCLGIPEFGTDFVIQMVVDAKPKSLSDLIRISGLSHGTDVWLNNAQSLIKDGVGTISTVICTRDDIMTFLINKGMDSEESFTIMERTRKGLVAKGKCKEWPEYKKDMLEHDVPQWYIESCEKIKYMFPKAHAAAYVMMAYRIAYCKVNYPLAYYAAYFSIRADAFSYELMCQGKDKLEYFLADYKKRSDELSKKEQDTLKDMKLVQEMYARGFEFTPIDVYKAKATQFQIIDDKLMPSFSSIEGMGDKAAEAVEEASKDGKYLSKDDFRQRTKVSKTAIDLMADLGILGDLPESNQLSLFDFH